MADIRVRYSPAPTGEIHVGNARTALFNWLYARHHEAVFILRIEDTDRSRTTDAAIIGVQETLRWLGIDWDEGPVLQSARTDLYRAAVDRLFADGAAYECFCTEAEIRERNEAARAAGRPPGYDGHCRALTTEQRAAYEAEGRPRVVRFRTPDSGVSRFHDLIRGDVEVDWSLIHDFVIVRSDGSPIFFLANAVDDIDMGITHVIRGEDLLDTTHRVLALRAALGGGSAPVYAHLPLILASDRAKLSKRHGADAVEEFRAEGYLPEALLNYLALLGWAPAGEGQEILTVEELVAEFELERVTHASAVFDFKKLDWMNGQWIRRLPLDELARRVEPEARARYGSRFDDDVFRQAVAIGQERAVTTAQLVDQMGFLFVDENDFVIGPESWATLAATERVQEVLDAVIQHIATTEWTVDALDLRGPIEAIGMKARKVMPALYTAVEGRAQGLPLFDSIWLLGRDRALRRLRAAREQLG
ncbi:MAG TPA: glutamate--tRNA ligase [Acidimicrobiia bacterium]|nr:glutamate--tRNA ligase [Acidimicrobiia bacterium]